MANFEKAFERSKLPPSVTMEQSGDVKQFKNAAGRMGGVIVDIALLRIPGASHDSPDATLSRMLYFI